MSQLTKTELSAATVQKIQALIQRLKPLAAIPPKAPPVKPISQLESLKPEDWNRYNTMRATPEYRRKHQRSEGRKIK